VGQRGLSRNGIINFSMEKELKIISWEHDFFIHHRIISGVKRVEFISDRMSYIVLKGRWCNSFVLNMHARSEEKSVDSKDSFLEELEQGFFYRFPKYHMKIQLVDFNEKCREREYFQSDNWK